MDTNDETPLQQDSPSTGLPDPGSSSAVIAHIAAAAPWVRFMAILGFITVVFTTFAGLFVLAAGLPDVGPAGRLVGALYIVMGLVYLYFLLPLNQSATIAGKLKANPSWIVAEEAMRYQTRFWKRIGIATIVIFIVSMISMVIIAIAAVHAST